MTRRWFMKALSTLASVFAIYEAPISALQRPKYHISGWIRSDGTFTVQAVRMPESDWDNQCMAGNIRVVGENARTVRVKLIAIHQDIVAHAQSRGWDVTGLQRALNNVRERHLALIAAANASIVS